MYTQKSTTQTIHTKQLLQGEIWLQDARLTFADGVITEIQSGVAPQPGDQLVDTLLPALANLHSHAFQRAMAGMTEVKTAGRESFWSWRSLMYQFLERLTPDQIEAIAALVYMEMLEAGYGSVGEFHYLHHQSDGAPYARLSELSDRIFSAANATGIGLTHLPVLYTYGGVNQEPLSGGQQRFSNDLDRFLQLVAECEAQLPEMPHDTLIGVAPHSLRATSPADLSALLAARPEGPLHIHIAEQIREVEEVHAKLGQTPVAWLLEQYDVSARWCLIHATHMSDAETKALAKTGAVAGLCPITEANLGDGIFNGATFVQAGGAFGVGSDSNVRISLTEELRSLEYSQRLRDRSRNVLVSPHGSVGQALYLGAAKGGAQALGRQAGAIKVGNLADLVAIDTAHPALCALRADQLLDGLCFAAPDQIVRECWSAGRHVVQGGVHIARDAIVARYQSAVSELLSSL